MKNSQIFTNSEGEGFFANLLNPDNPDKTSTYIKRENEIVFWVLYKDWFPLDQLDSALWVEGGSTAATPGRIWKKTARSRLALRKSRPPWETYRRIPTTPSLRHRGTALDTHHRIKSPQDMLVQREIQEGFPYDITNASMRAHAR